MGWVVKHRSWLILPSPREQRVILNVIIIIINFFFTPWEKKAIGAGLQLEARACALLSLCELERCPWAEHRSAGCWPQSLQVRWATGELTLPSGARK